MNKILIVTILLSFNTSVLAESQLENNLCTMEKELSLLNNPNNLPELQYKILQNLAKSNLEKAKSMAGITCSPNNLIQTKVDESKFKWSLDKTKEENKVQEYKEAMLKAGYTQPFNQAKYKLCEIQLKWELAWKQLSKKDKNFYEWSLRENIEEGLGINKHDQCMSFIPQKVINNISRKLGVATFNRSEKHIALNPKHPNGYGELEDYVNEEIVEDNKVSIAKAEPSNRLKEFSPLIQFCDMKKTTYERNKCKKSIPERNNYIVEGIVSNIISKNKFILKLASDQYANIYGNFDDDSMQHLISLSNTGNKISFIGELKELGTGVIIKHDFNYIGQTN